MIANGIRASAFTRHGRNTGTGKIQKLALRKQFEGYTLPTEQAAE
jgi:hypothetical protein